MNHPAGTLNRSGQPQRQLQRIQMPTLGIKQPRLIALAGNPVGQLVPGDELQTVVTPFVAGFVLPFGEQTDPARHHRGPQVPGPIVAIEAMASR
ncbi:hypothetical protein D3C87_1778420 [compost metagenome]